jgi:hypothetical protein
MITIKLDQWHDRVFSSKRFTLLIACIVFAPLLFINVRNSSDWGDDFAQYIHQAKNIVEGIPQSQTGYVYNPDYPVGGPKAYPAGFPLLLAPAWALAGNNLYAFTFTIALITYLLALCMTLFFMRYFRALSALILTACFVYNPQVILFKQEVMSDLPFGLILVALTLIYTEKEDITYLKSIVIALLIGFLISIKSMGLFFPMAIIADTIHIAFIRRKKSAIKTRLNLIQRIIMVAGGIGLYTWLNMRVFQLPSGGGIRDYLYIFHFRDVADTATIMIQNLATYMEALRYIFVLQIGDFNAAGLVTACIAMSMLYFGILRNFIKGFGFLEISGLSYLAVLLIYPYSHGTYRFIFPMGFLLIYYMALGFKGFDPGITISGLGKSVVAGCILLILLTPTLIQQIRTRSYIMDGPQQKNPKEAFAWIRDNTPANAIIAFAKPRALSLYTNRYGFANLPDQDIAPMHVRFLKEGVTYLLESKALSDESFHRYIRMNDAMLEHVWGNKEFDLYRLHKKISSAY